MTEQRLIVQSGAQSLISFSACATAATVPAPPALVAGDTIIVIASTDGGDAPEIADGEWQSITVAADSGLTTTLAHRHVYTDAQAEALIQSGVAVQFGQESQCGNFFSMRITGADPTWLIEDYKPSVGSISTEGYLSIPSLDPHHRRSNTVLYVTTAEYDVSGGAPSVTVAGAAPLTTTVQPPPTEDRTDALLTSLSSRPLFSAEPTGEARVAVSESPLRASSVAFMLRSLNRPPEITLPEAWSAEVGRQSTVSATVTDIDRTPYTLAWTQTAGPAPLGLGGATGSAVTFTPTAAGVYGLELVATDVDGGRTVARTTVTVPTGTSGPQSIVSSAGWASGGEGPLTAVDLSDRDDATFARTVDLPVGEPLVLSLPPIYGGAAVTVGIRGAATNPSPPLSRTVILKQDDGQVIAERTYPLGTLMETKFITTTRAETAMITSRSAMTVTIIDEVA